MIPQLTGSDSDKNLLTGLHQQSQESVYKKDPVCSVSVLLNIIHVDIV
jgi:hypothetical protein